MATVTFLLTDVEGSTAKWQRDPDAMSAALARHDALIEAAVTTRGGRLVKSRGEGDSTFSVFDRPAAALAAAAYAQAALTAEVWPAGMELRVRAAAHTGEVEERDGDFFGPVVNRCARLRSAAHGGQTVCTAATAELSFDHLPPGVALRSLGSHRLRDLDRPEQVFQVCGAGSDDEFPPLTSADTGRHNLPAPRTSFVGREDELAIVAKHLEASRLVTLTGVGGCGKTRLALTVAAECAGRFPDGLLWIELAPVSDPDNVPVALAAAIGSPLRAGDSHEQLIELLDRRATLVVLDNCEHLIDAVAELADRLLDGCPNVTILATSREALEVEGEQTHTVRSLSLPGSGPLSGECESVQLFCERARAAHEQFRLDAHNRADVEEICRRLDGVPLAIELAAAQVGHLPPHEIADRLDTRLTLLSGGRRRVQRQQTLAATLDWSHELLAPEQRVLFRRLAVFSGTFGLDAVEEVCGFDLRTPAVSIVHSLVAKSLVDYVGGEAPRYRLLETVRMYAEEKLMAAAEAEIIRDRHRDHYLGWLEALPEDDIVFGGFLHEQHNLRAGLRWSESQDRLELVARMASLMMTVWDLVDAPEGIRWMELALGALDQLEDQVRARVLVARQFIAIAALEEGFMDRDDDLLGSALAVAGDRPGLWTAGAYSLLALGEGGRFLRAMAAGEYAADAPGKIEAYARKASELAETAAARAFSRLWVGHARAAVGDLAGALEATEEARRCATHAPFWLPYVDATLSFLCHLTGDRERALRAAEAAQAAADPELTALWPTTDVYALLALPLALAAEGAHDDALDLMDRSLREAKGSPVGGVLVAAVMVLAAMAGLRGDWERCAVLLGAVLAGFGRDSARSPVDVALYIHYSMQAGHVLGERLPALQERGAGLGLQEALSYGLEGIDREAALPA